MKSDVRKRLVKEAYRHVEHLDLPEEEWMYSYLDTLIDLVLDECIQAYDASYSTQVVRNKFGVDS